MASMVRAYVDMIIAVILFFVFGILAFFIVPLLYKLTTSLYNRKGIESITKEKFGTVPISNIITDEILIVSYDYNNQEPRLFSKYSA